MLCHIVKCVYEKLYWLQTSKQSENIWATVVIMLCIYLRCDLVIRLVDGQIPVMWLLRRQQSTKYLFRLVRLDVVLCKWPESERLLQNKICFILWLKKKKIFTRSIISAFLLCLGDERRWWGTPRSYLITEEVAANGGDQTKLNVWRWAKSSCLGQLADRYSWALWKRRSWWKDSEGN